MPTVRIVGADADGSESAAFFLGTGEPVVIPTDTVYGLAVDPTLPGASQLMFEAKRRGRDLPVAVLVSDGRQGWSLAVEPAPAALDLAARWWPGPLTLVVPRAPGWPADLGDVATTVGLRCPDHAWVRALCARVGPLAVTSANLHGDPTPGTARAAGELFDGWTHLVVDGGTLPGKASTVVDCTVDPPQVLRQGAITALQIQEALR